MASFQLAFSNPFAGEMGARFARARPAAEGQGPQEVEDVDGESKVELKGDPFEIRLISLYWG